MNLREKQELKQKLESLYELMQMIPEGLIFEHTHTSYSTIARVCASNLALCSNGDSVIALNLALRTVKLLVSQIIIECEV